MARAPKPFRHRGHWITTVGGKQTRLCPDTEPEAVARLRLNELIAGRAASPQSMSESPPVGATRTLAEVLDIYLTRHVPVYYRKRDGSPAAEVASCRAILARLARRHGDTPVTEVTRSNLKDFLNYLIKPRWFRRGRGLMRPREIVKPNRKIVNQQFARVRRAFRWLAQEELIPDALDAAVARIPNLPAHRSAATESAPVEAVSEADYRRTVGPDDDTPASEDHRYLPYPWRDVARLGWLTGMRPGEVVKLEVRHLVRDPAGAIVAVDFGFDHKGGHRGKTRAVAIGPAARVLLDRRLMLAGPRETGSIFTSLRHGKKITPRAYANTLAKFCDRGGIPRWHPNQLRHSYGTRVRRRFGLEGAQVALGHAQADVTQIYAETDLTQARTIADELG